MYSRKKKGKKIVVLLVVLVMVLGGAIGSTLAYLLLQSETITNTFVAGNIGTLNLEESDTTEISGAENTYVVVPGKAITKDPKVTYTPANSNDVGPVYVFVKVEGVNWNYDNNNNGFSTTDGLSWTVDSKWTKLSDISENVFYILTNATKNVNNQSIIANDTISVSSAITNSKIENAADNASGLTFTAYAIQAEGFNDAAAAWNNAKPNN